MKDIHHDSVVLLATVGIWGLVPTRYLMLSMQLLSFLEDHLVGTVVLSKRELGSKVVLHQGSLVNSLQDGSINLLLVSLTGVNGSLGLVVSEETLLAISISRVNTGEVGIVDLGNIGTRDINLGRGSHNISLVDTTERNTVDLVWSSDKEKSRLKGLKAHNTLSTETSSEEDADGSWGEGSTDLGSVVLLSPGVLGTGDVVGGVESGGLSSGRGSLGGLLRSSSSEYTLLRFEEGGCR